VTETEWLSCTDPQPMLEYLRGKVSERKLRLFACACWRYIPWRHYGYTRLTRAVETAERYADGLASLCELLNRKSEAWQLAKNMQRFVYDRLPPLRGKQPREILLVAYATEQRLSTLSQRLSEVLAWEEAFPLTAAFLRDLFDNPFRPVSLDPTWQTPEGVRLAQAIYDDHAFDRLPIVADALEEAGCANPDVLSHCRQQGTVHVRGCWLIDLLLNKA
jgi:hypothetical protein